MTKYTITHNYGMCPNQIEGHTDDGRHFYFRGRHEAWSLGFGSTPDEAIESDDYEGDILKGGYFEPEEWEAFFWDVIDNCVEKGRPNPSMRAGDIKVYQRALQDIHDEILPKSPNWSIPVHEVIDIIRKHHPDWMS
jgi:hypothetical protein